ncbi:MAG: hypothetical protein GX409_02280 [candidate division Zixibacteria bacterium]|nr:hypothetical protein [candidate division Zixibacteria bacterium]
MVFYFRNKSLKVILIWFIFTFHFSPVFGGKIYIQAGKQIDIKFISDISTETEQPMRLEQIAEVASEDTIAGVIVFKPGCKIFGEIKANKPGHLGKPGNLRVRIDSVQTVQGKTVPIRQPLVLSITGKSHKRKALMMLPLLGYGYFIKGEHAILKVKDKIITAKTARMEEINF